MTKAFKHKFIASVVIPVYNKERYLESCLDSLLRQSCGIDKLEVICINDGSTDQSWSILEKYSKRYPSIVCVNQENSGVSVARNNGILKASAEYIFFLDADDSLSSNTIQDVVDFFDTIKDETDIVTFPIYYDFGQGKIVPNRRGDKFPQNCLIKIEDYPYFAQTTMNFCIKNHDGLPLFQLGQPVYEDQLFNLLRVLSKKSLGWCSTAKYIYRKNVSGASQADHPYFTFDLMIKVFNQMLDICGKDSIKLSYTSHLILFSVGWRLSADRIFPYQLKGQDWLRAMGKIEDLICRIPSQEILNSPWLTLAQRNFLLSLQKRKLKPIVTPLCWELSSPEGTVMRDSKITLIIFSERIRNGKLCISGYLDSVILNFVGKPRLNLVIDELETELAIKPANALIIGSHYKAGICWGFDVEVQLTGSKNISFKVEINGRVFDTELKFKKWLPQSRGLKYYIPNYQLSLMQNSIQIVEKRVSYFDFFNDSNCYSKKLKSVALGVFLLKKIAFNFRLELPEYDSKVVYLQVGNNKKSLFIRKDSSLFKILFFLSSEITISSPEDIRLIKFLSQKTWPLFYSLLSAKITFKPNKIIFYRRDDLFSRENNIHIDEIYVREEFEKKYFVDLLHYPKSCVQLIKENKESTKPLVPNENILWVLTWRSYFDAFFDNGLLIQSKFEQSLYFKKIKSFINNEQLKKILGHKKITLCIRLEDKMEKFRSSFEFKNLDNIKLSSIEETPNNDSQYYSLLMTDYSESMFDYLQKGLPVAKYVPDLEYVEAGFHTFNKLCFEINELGLDKINTPSDLICLISK